MKIRQISTIKISSKKILAIVDSDIFNYKSKIGKFKYSNIMNLIINIKNNAISEILAKKNLHALNEIKKTEIRNKRLISSQKKKNSSTNLQRDNNNVGESESESEKGSESLHDSESKRVDENDDNNYKDEDENEDKIKNINNYFKTIDESAPLEEQINLLRIMDEISRYWHMSYMMKIKT